MNCRYLSASTFILKSILCRLIPLIIPVITISIINIMEGPCIVHLEEEICPDSNYHQLKPEPSSQSGFYKFTHSPEKSPLAMVLRPFQAVCLKNGSYSTEQLVLSLQGRTQLLSELVVYSRMVLEGGTALENYGGLDLQLLLQLSRIEIMKDVAPALRNMRIMYKFFLVVAMFFAAGAVLLIVSIAFEFYCLYTNRRINRIPGRCKLTDFIRVFCLFRKENICLINLIFFIICSLDSNPAPSSGSIKTNVC